MQDLKLTILILLSRINSEDAPDIKWQDKPE
ncbi:Uncharacterised protein [Serratia quinivorans]|nr:Uncharacterised protein [Serratia quinivorans]CAI1055716.1 Uncharacterised protein [Serratia quinivorans]CAI1136233.1 Uncharacterised protein [Serratia quinivorans]CAI1142997.1 Uncharacterised protein [Serratia quinivorans]CAI1216733.1 Uncharacterised protein [Serratia quinivorans]